MEARNCQGDDLAGLHHQAVVRSPSRPLHRLAAARAAERVSHRAVARRLRTEVSHVKQQEKSQDLPLSVLYQWAEALEVPVSELLIEPGERLSAPLAFRAAAVRLMKTAKAIQQRAGRPTVERMAQQLIDLLLEIMPELKEISAWPAVGRRRHAGEQGQTAHRIIPTHLFDGRTL